MPGITRNQRRAQAKEQAKLAAKHKSALEAARAGATDPAQALRVAGELFSLGRAADALPGLQAAISQYPEHSELGAALGYALAATGQLQKSAELYGRLVEAQPDNAGLQTNLALLLIKLGKRDAAQAALERVLQLLPHHANTQYAYAELIARSDPEKAFKLYRGAAKDFRAQIGPRPTLHHSHDLVKLANAELWSGDIETALIHYDQAIDLRPDFTLAHARKGAALAKLSRRNEAIKAFKRAAALEPNFAEVRRAIGDLMLESGDSAGAARHLKKAAEINPQDQLAQYFLAAIKQDAVPDAPPPQYVEQLFDDYAAKFDHHLVNVLKYRVPEIICSALLEVVQPKDLRVIDLGCGTGLCGPLLKPASSYLIGVDLSERMLDKARTREVYDELIHSELVRALQHQGTLCDVAVAADVLVYIGALDSLFAHCHAALKPRAYFAFTVEHHAGEGFILNTTGRYCHAESYIRAEAAAHGFEIVRAETVVPRYQSGVPVEGGLYIVQRRD